MRTTVILGAGNELMKDEGVGVHTIRILHNKLDNSRPDIKLMDVGTSSDFGHLIEGADKLVIVDAVEGSCEPGTIYRFTPQQIEFESRLTASIHQIGILENLRMLELMGTKIAETVIIGVEPAEVEAGLSLSPEIELQMPKIIESVLNEINH
jgi:hydrogenase maturation protease